MFCLNTWELKNDGCYKAAGMHLLRILLLHLKMCLLSVQLCVLISGFVCGMWCLLTVKMGSFWVSSCSSTAFHYY